MEFHTRPEYRNADMEPNDNYKDANEVYLNEIISGNFHSSGDKDFYRIGIPNSGELNLKAIRPDGGRVRLYLYGENETDGSTLAHTYDGGTTRRITKDLEAGTYYDRVYNSSGYGGYKLNLDFY